jgi:hypothetical protein
MKNKLKNASGQGGQGKSILLAVCISISLFSPFLFAFFNRLAFCLDHPDHLHFSPGFLSFCLDHCLDRALTKTDFALTAVGQQTTDGQQPTGGQQPLSRATAGRQQPPPAHNCWPTTAAGQ